MPGLRSTYESGPARLWIRQVTVKSSGTMPQTRRSFGSHAGRPARVMLRQTSTNGRRVGVGQRDRMLCQADPASVWQLAKWAPRRWNSASREVPRTQFDRLSFRRAHSRHHHTFPRNGRDFKPGTQFVSEALVPAKPAPPGPGEHPVWSHMGWCDNDYAACDWRWECGHIRVGIISVPEIRIRRSSVPIVTVIAGHVSGVAICVT